MPEAVPGTNGDGFYSFDSNAVLSYSVKAIQELNLKLEDLAPVEQHASSTGQATTTPFVERFWISLFARLTAWFADATNGITDFFARRGHFQDELCVGDTCVTPAQFQAVFGNQSATAGAQQPVSEGLAGAPGGSPASGGEDAGSATTIPPTETGASGEAPTTVSPTPDTTDPAEADPEVDELEAADELPTPEPANDNGISSPPQEEELPATGTE